MTYAYLLKYIVVGESGVGKSCLLLQFTDHRFVPIHDITIGVEFGTRLLDVHDTTIKCQVWDTAGQENYRSITRSYYRGACCAILVYDVTKRRTFNRITQWIEETKRCTNNPHIVMVLVGNKIDLLERDPRRRQVSEEEAKQLAEEHKMLFLETSAKTGKHVQDVFECAADQVLTALDKGDIQLGMDTFGISGYRPSGRNLLGDPLVEDVNKKSCPCWKS
jgi:Ras-related protein Rab-2A